MLGIVATLRVLVNESHATYHACPAGGCGTERRHAYGAVRGRLDFGARTPWTQGALDGLVHDPVRARFEPGASGRSASRHPLERVTSRTLPCGPFSFAAQDVGGVMQHIHRAAERRRVGEVKIGEVVYRPVQ